MTIAARRIDSIVIEPGQTFSYHHAVGRPSRLRGFRPGLELHDGALSRGIGGGCCMVSNLLYLLALRSGMTIVERHRHALDLFPDHGRAVPFGCGATVFYNMADLRFRNDLAFPVLLSLKVDGGCLSGEFRSPGRPPFTVEVYEVEHHFERTAGGWVRENRLRRRVVADDGSTLCDEEIAHNVARVLYNPEEV